VLLDKNKDGYKEKVNMHPSFETLHSLASGKSLKVLKLASKTPICRQSKSHEK